jgi:hypothetical protein
VNAARIAERSRRAWRARLLNQRGSFLPEISRTLPRRVLYAGVFFYASFLAHTAITSSRGEAIEPTPQPVARAEPLASAVAEPWLSRLLGLTPGLAAAGRSR